MGKKDDNECFSRKTILVYLLYYNYNLSYIRAVKMIICLEIVCPGPVKTSLFVWSCRTAWCHCWRLSRGECDSSLIISRWDKWLLWNPFLLTVKNITSAWQGCNNYSFMSCFLLNLTHKISGTEKKKNYNFYILRRNSFNLAIFQI